MCASCRDWNPAVDKHLPKNYNITNFKEGKRACKMALQEELGLPVNADIPLIAFIGRLDYQKGADIVLQVCPGWF
jgi:starch synthase